MGQLIDFAKTKALLLAMDFAPAQDTRVNLGVGDEDDEFLLLLQGKRMVACQVEDDELVEIFTLYAKARRWIELDVIGKAVTYETLELTCATGSGVVLMCGEDGVEGIQLILHEGATVLAIEPDLLDAFHALSSWFLLNAVVPT